MTKLINSQAISKSEMNMQNTDAQGLQEIKQDQNAVKQDDSVKQMSESEILKKRIEKAIFDFCGNRAAMHVPPLDSDVDVVLSDCLSFTNGQQKRIDKQGLVIAKIMSITSDLQQKWETFEIGKKLEQALKGEG